MLQVDNLNNIIIDNEYVGLSVVQTTKRTIVFNFFKEYELPKQRYSLSTDFPDSGMPGRLEFEQDIKNLLEEINNV